MKAEHVVRGIPLGLGCSNLIPVVNVIPVL
jgi:hypothetical protein